MIMCLFPKKFGIISIKSILDSRSLEERALIKYNSTQNSSEYIQVLLKVKYCFLVKCIDRFLTIEQFKILWVNAYNLQLSIFKKLMFIIEVLGCWLGVKLIIIMMHLLILVRIPSFFWYIFKKRVKTLRNLKISILGYQTRLRRLILVIYFGTKIWG
jgi:hypothetical protein